MGCVLMDDFADALLMVKAGHPELAGPWGKLLGGGGGDKPWDEMTWDDVIAATKNGKYRNFEIGAMKELDLGSEGIVHMQIVGIDVDDLADGSGKAPLTFISKELLKTSHRMNPALTPSAAPYDEGTGTIGGWEKCEMRTYLKETVKPLIPENVRGAIQNVTKYSTIYDTSSTIIFDVITADDIWIPSSRESGASFVYAEKAGPMYSVFGDKASRIKFVFGSETKGRWQLRSASTTTSFYAVSLDGGNGSAYRAGTNGYIALGFCL